MALSAPPRPLAQTDDRHAFDCGKDALNNWLRRHAWTNHVDGASRVSVICGDEPGKIIGFVTLSASQIERGFLPKAQQRNRPDPLPTTLLGQLAVDKAFHGQGYATTLLLFALRTALNAAQSVGSIGVVTHPLDDALRGFYARWGFSEMPFDPRRSMLLGMRDIKVSFQQH